MFGKSEKTKGEPPVPDPTTVPATEPVPVPAPQTLNALEQSKLAGAKRRKFHFEPLKFLLSKIPLLNVVFELKPSQLNFDPRYLSFNAPPGTNGSGANTRYASNKIRSTKYTPLSFLPLNIILQFQNVANIYFLLIAILSGFDIFGVSDAGLASVPIIVIVVITAIRDGAEDWRRRVMDLETNNTVTVVLTNVTNPNATSENVGPWRWTKKKFTRGFRKCWKLFTHEEDPLEVNNDDVNENQSIRVSMNPHYQRRDSGAIGAATTATDTTGTVTDTVTATGRPSMTSTLNHYRDEPTFKLKYWKDVRVGDFVKVYADQGVPADLVVLSSSDQEGDCFIDTRNLDGETSLKSRRALQSTKTVRRPWHLAQQKFTMEVEGANSNLDSFGFKFHNLITNESEAINSSNFLPRGSTVRNTRWVIGFVVYTGKESKIILNAGATPHKKSRLARELNLYVLWSFLYLFCLCLISGIVEGVKFRNKQNSLYFFENGLLTKNTALNGFVTFFAAMLVFQNLVPISLYISIEVARTFLAYFMYADCHMYDEATDYPCTPKSWALSDDLGQIEFIFSDKTGTLTMNSMVFRKCTINGKTYGTAFTESMAGKLKRQNRDAVGLRNEFMISSASEREKMNSILESSYDNPYLDLSASGLISAPIAEDLDGESGSEQQKAVQNFALALAICNTVVTEMREHPTRSARGTDGRSTHGGDHTGRRSAHGRHSNLGRRNRHRSATSIAESLDRALSDEPLEAPPPLPASSEVFGAPGRHSVSSVRTRPSIDHSTSNTRPSRDLMSNKTLIHKSESPDESALVQMARSLGYTLVEDGKHHKIIDERGKFCKYTVLQTIMFSSQRKRMSTIVKNEENQYFLYTKGADSVISELLANECKRSVQYRKTLEEVDAFGDDGLRTLLIARRELDPKFATSWSARYKAALESPNRDELTEQLASEIEKDLELLGSTGIEDQLQEDASHTIELLGKAGIKLWMLTGDKVETAISIGFSCNMLDNKMNLLVVRKASELAIKLSELNLEVNPQTLAEAGKDHSPASGNNALVIDGVALSELVKDNNYRLEFALLGKKCKAVLCCRVSPSQKAAVVQIMKSTFDVTTLAIGDGANDISMIQEADIGVGIVGVEGRQAAMSADYAIGQFRFLQRLLLVHGRWSYQRVASMTENILFENFLFSTTLFWYGIYNQFDQSYLYDYTYITLFNALFVSCPVVIRGILDQDLPDYVLLQHPQLYAQGILRKAWSKKRYVIMLIDSLYQSAIAFFLCYSVVFNGGFYTITGRDIAYRQGMGVFVGHTAIFACNTYVMLGQFRWDWLSVLVFVVSNMSIFFWTGIYSSANASQFFFKSAAHVYSSLTFWAYFLVSFVCSILPRFAFNCVQKLWFPNDVDIVREMYHRSTPPMQTTDGKESAPTDTMIPMNTR